MGSPGWMIKEKQQCSRAYILLPIKNYAFRADRHLCIVKLFYFIPNLGYVNQSWIALEQALEFFSIFSHLFFFLLDL